MLQCKYFSVNKATDHISEVELITTNPSVIRNEEQTLSVWLFLAIFDS